MKKPTIKQLIPLLKKFKNKYRPILSNALVQDNKLTISDLTTSITIFDVNLKNGIHDINKIHLVGNPIDIDVNEYPLIKMDLNIKKHLIVSVKQLESLKKHISKDETRPHLNGICWNKNELVATDGFTLQTCKLYDTANENQQTEIFSIKSINILINLMKKFKINEVSLGVNEDNKFIVNVVGCFVLQGTIVNREYPMYERIIPQKAKKMFTITEKIDFKAIKPFLDKRLPKIKLINKNSDLYLQVNEGELEFKVGVAFDKFKFAFFNADYLKRTLETSNCKVFRQEKTLGPYVLQYGDSTGLIMPMKY